MRHFIYLAYALILLFLSASASAQQDVISTVVGGGPNDMPALSANIANPTAVAVDSAGNYYVATAGQNRVFKIDTTGKLTIFAGTGLAGFSGDGGPATQANLSNPQGLAVDGLGNVFISDTSNEVIREVDHTSGIINTVVGTPGACLNGNGPATSPGVGVCTPEGLAFDASGHLYIADFSNLLVRELSAGNLSTIAGDGACTLDGNGAALTHTICEPFAVAVDGSGNVYATEFAFNRVRKISAGSMTTIAGSNTTGACGNASSALSTSGSLCQPTGVVVDAAGNVYVSESQAVIREITGTTVSTVAGVLGSCGFADGTPGTSLLCGPFGMAFLSGNVLIADESNNRVRSLAPSTNTLSTVAGNGSASQPNVVEGIPATADVLNSAFGVAEDAAGNIYVADTQNNRVRKVDVATGNINTIAGTGNCTFDGDGVATAHSLCSPEGLAVDSSGNVYVADEANQIIRKVDTAGNMTTIAGTPQSCVGLCNPFGVALDAAGNLYIADSSFNRIDKLDTSLNLTTVAGTGTAGYSGDGGPAVTAMLNFPQGVAVDATGNLYIADSNNGRVRRVDAITKNISTVAGNGSCSTYISSGPAAELAICLPASVTVDRSGDMFISDSSFEVVRWVDSAGLMQTIAGDVVNGFNGDGSVATSAELSSPAQIAEDANGNFLLSDQANFRVRKINAFAGLNRSTGSLTFGTQAVGTTTTTPQTVTLSAIGPLIISSITTVGDFSEVDNCPTGAMANGSTCTVWVYFTPTASGVRAGSIVINDNGFLSTSQTVQLTGSGTALSITGTLSFGSVLLNTSVTKSVTLKNGGTTAVAINSISVTDTTDYSFASSTTCPSVAGVTAAGSLAAKSSCTISVTFDPKTTGSKKATLVVSSADPASPLLLGITGTGSSFESMSPNPINFTAAQLMGTTSKPVKVTFKYSGTGTLTLTGLSSSAPFSINTTGISSGACVPGTTMLNSTTPSCVFNVVFSPTTSTPPVPVSGSVTATYSGSADSTTSLTITANGTATEVKLSATTLSFGTVNPPATASKSVTITNVSTTVTLHVSGTSITGTNASDYTVTGNTCGSVNPGTTCTITVQFAPPVSSATARTATLNIFDDGGGSPQTVKLTGF